MNVLKKYFKGDPVIWAVIIALAIISLLSVYSSTGTLAYRYQGGNTAYYVIKHSSLLVMGLIIIFITHLIPYKYYSRLSQLLLVLSVPLLIITLILGTNYNQASRWLTFPGLGFTIQTSDFAKLALIMYVARLLSLKQYQIKDFNIAFLPILIPIVIICLLILPANLSTSVILFSTCMILMFIGRISLKHLLFLLLCGMLVIACFVIAAKHVKKEGRISTWENRIESYFNGDSESNYQVEQAKIAIVSGGVIGKGPGNSTQRNILPQPYSDFIYALIIEEYGLIGGTIVLFLYLFLLYRAGVIVKKCQRTFPAFLAIGLVISLVFQALINMGVAVNIFPVTGQNLPLVSMGGTSLLFTCTAFGIILSVSRGQTKLEEQIVYG